MLIKSRLTVFVSVMCFTTMSQALGAVHEEDDFQRSNYYTNDQGNNVGEIQNQDKNAVKRQDKKVEHFRNNHAKYHEPKRYSSNKYGCGADGSNVIKTNNGYQTYKMAEERTNIEKRSQIRRGESRVVASQSHEGHFHIPSGRVQYHDGGMSHSNVLQLSRPKSEAQRLVRKSFNDQANSNWRWGFRRKQSKDHPLKDTSSYAGENHNVYKNKESMNGRNAHCEAMVRNGHLSENSVVEGNARQNALQSETKMVGMKSMAEEQHQRPYAPRQGMSEERMYRAMGQPSIQQWDSKERTEGADYQWDNNLQKTDVQPNAAAGWMREAPRNVYSAPKYDSEETQNVQNAPKYDAKEIQSPYRNPHLETQNDAMRAEHPKIDYNQELNGPVETKVLNKPIENVKISIGIPQQIPKNRLQSQMAEVRNNYQTRNNEQIQNSPKMDEQSFDQFQKGRPGYESGLNANIPGIDNVQQPETVRFDAQDAVPRMGGASGVDDQNQENRWDDGSLKVNVHRMKISHTANSKYNPGKVPSSSPLEVQIQQQKAKQPERSQTEEIRFLVLSPAEFNPETLRRTLGEPEKPRGIPYCTLEEYKMESASLKAKSYDAHERDMRYNGKGSINELISRLKRNNHQTLRGCGRHPIKSRASGEGPEMPVCACTATPSTREHSIGIVTQTEGIHEAATMCWADSLTRPTVSAEDLGINFRITPSYSYDHLRGRLPVISQFDYTAGTSCSTPCQEPKATCQSKRKRYVHFLQKKRKRTPDEILLSSIIRKLQNTTAIPKLTDAKKILPNTLEEEKIIEKYLTVLMVDQINRPKNQLKNVLVKAGPGWLEKLLKELAEKKLKSKMKIAYKDKPRIERTEDHAHSKLSMVS